MRANVNTIDGVNGIDGISGIDGIKTFRYRRDAAGWYILAFAVWVFGVVVTVLTQWFPADEPGELRNTGVLLLLSSLPAIYCFYLLRVARSAVLILDKDGLTYRDYYVRGRLGWNEVVELTPRWIKGARRKGIFFKLGLFAMENWQELERLVLQRAALSPVKVSRHWGIQWEGLLKVKLVRIEWVRLARRE